VSLGPHKVETRLYSTFALGNYVFWIVHLSCDPVLAKVDSSLLSTAKIQQAGAAGRSRIIQPQIVTGKHKSEQS
jgi:hypothetical protein